MSQKQQQQQQQQQQKTTKVSPSNPFQLLVCEEEEPFVVICHEEQSKKSNQNDNSKHTQIDANLLNRQEKATTNGNTLQRKASDDAKLKISMDVEDLNEEYADLTDDFQRCLQMENEAMMEQFPNSEQLNGNKCKCSELSEENMKLILDVDKYRKLKDLLDEEILRLKFQMKSLERNTGDASVKKLQAHISDLEFQVDYFQRDNLRIREDVRTQRAAMTKRSPFDQHIIDTLKKRHAKATAEIERLNAELKTAGTKMEEQSATINHLREQYTDKTVKSIEAQRTAAHYKHQFDDLNATIQDQSQYIGQLQLQLRQCELEHNVITGDRTCKLTCPKCGSGFYILENLERHVHACM